MYGDKLLKCFYNLIIDRRMFYKRKGRWSDRKQHERIFIYFAQEGQLNLIQTKFDGMFSFPRTKFIVRSRLGRSFLS